MELIISYLSIREQIKLDTVNKEFHSIISNEKEWKKKCEKLGWNVTKSTPLYKSLYFKNLSSNCIECGKKTQCYYSLWKFCVCLKCRFKVFYNKTQCKTNFNLEEDEINTFQCDTVNISNGVMYLYLKEDVHHYIKVTYGSVQKKVEEKDKILREKKEKKDKKEEKIQQRKDELDKALRDVNIFNIDPTVMNVYEDYTQGRKKSLEKTVSDIKHHMEIITTTNFLELYQEKTKELSAFYQDNTRAVSKEKYRKLILDLCVKK